MKTSIQNPILGRALAFCLGIVAASSNCLHAATFTVTSANISGPGSLPVAIAQANATPGKNLIKISVTNPITLGLALPAITNSVNIVGVANVPAIISGGGTLPIFTFSVGTTNSLSNLVLANGYTINNGAAINNGGTLAVISCIITNHQATEYQTNSNFGGAIINSGTMSISLSVISGNLAGYYLPGFNNGDGGAIYNSGTMTLNKCLLSGNTAGNGGAIFNTGGLTSDTLTLSNNLATAGFGGGIYNNGPLSISQSTFAKNSATGASGVAGFNGGGGGGGGGFGGALFSSSATVVITNSTFTQNAVYGGNGGTSYPSQLDSYGGNGGGVAGGTGGTLTGFAGGLDGGFGSGGGGAAGGPGYYSGGAGGFGGGGGGSGYRDGGGGGQGGYGGGGGSGGNSTYGGGGGGGAGFGGALFLQNGNCSLVNCTIVNNSSTGGLRGGTSGPPGDPGQGMAAGVFNYSGTVSLLNTIVAGNLAGNSDPDLVGSFVSYGSNLIGNNQGATNLSIFDFQNVAANVGPLQSNGGSTPTCAPLPGSYAIGYGTSAGAPTTDQRGVPRPQNGAYDIGAVQVVTGSPCIVGSALVKGSGYTLNTIFDSTNKYRIQASTNLTSWIDLTTNSSGGTLYFTDPGATNLTRRFYRTITP